MARTKFPTLAMIILVFAVIWLITDLGYLNINIPWLPLALIIISLGWIFNRFSRD